MDEERAEFDVIVVGAGSSGSVLAARLSEDPARRVLVIEWGDAGPIEVELRDGQRHAVPRGTGVGGSGLINGGYFVRPRARDLDDWARAAPGWDHASSLPFMTALESDQDFGDRPGHGASGPVPVARPPLDHPIAAAFREASLAAGHAFEPDKNSEGQPGVGPIPLNIIDGIRWDMGTAYLAPALHRPNLELVAARATRLLFDRGRAVGVAAHGAGGAAEYRAAEVVLAAGAIGTAQLLQQSGVGPADVLQRAGIEVVADLPVATAFSDHPQIRLDWVAAPLPPSAHALAVALNDGDVEIMPIVQPMAEAFPGSGLPGGMFSTLVTLEAGESRGRFELGSMPRYDYLSTTADLSSLRSGLRMAVRLMTSAPFAALGVRLIDPPPLADPDLDAWIIANLGTAFHLSGTAPLGSVVEATGRVLGVDGLSVGDVSILPTVPSRGTALAAVLVAERISAAIRSSAPPAPSPPL